MRPSSISIAEDSDDSNALSFCGRNWHGYTRWFQWIGVRVLQKPGVVQRVCRYASNTDKETSQWQCRHQLTPPCSIARFGIWRQGFSTSPMLWSLVRWALVVGMLVGIIHVRVRVFSRVAGRIHVRVRASHRHQRGVLVVAMVKPTWLGSVSITRGSGLSYSAGGVVLPPRW